MCTIIHNIVGGSLFLVLVVLRRYQDLSDLLHLLVRHFSLLEACHNLLEVVRSDCRRRT